VRLGLLTGGGDCPGLNAVIRAVVVGGAVRHGDVSVGFLDGWRGIIEGTTVPLIPDECRHILTRGGTILGSSRTNPFAAEESPARILATVADLGIDAVVAIGGDDTLGAADRLFSLGLPVVGVPKTIDNDLSGTEVTFGFDTAVQIATEAIDRLQTTAESHHRVMVCEVMGRNVGHIAVHAGMAGGAAEILIPEAPFSLDEVCQRLRARHAGGRYFSTVVVAEGAIPAASETQTARTLAAGADQFGHGRLGGIGAYLAEEIERITGYEARATVLGHIQRGGSPSAFDRVLATRFGAAALEAVHDGAFGTMMALQSGRIVRVPLADATGKPKTVDPHLYRQVAGLYLG
jgi:ATP-dependent phosphofructokinase / diphosphate-dependent phosphofructokinase